jgi:glyoxylate reductase
MESPPLAERPAVFLGASIPRRVLEELERDFRVVSELGEAEGALVTPAVAVDEEFVSRGGDTLKVVANYATGVNNIDFAATARRGIVVTNTPDIVTAPTAELAVALMLALLRRVVEGDRVVRHSDWEFGLEFMLGESLHGKVLGIVGAGKIGKETARLAEAFGSTAVYARRGDPLEPVLAQSDIISLHLPLTADTHHLIDANALSQMKSTAVLVNTARGPIVDEAALADALLHRRIAGAALDVYEFEPRVTESLRGLDNVVFTPHLGSATRETREGMGMLAVDALRAVLIEGTLPPNVVSPPAG